MADETRGSAVPESTERRPLTWLWMGLAVLTVAGFLTWLGLSSEPTVITVVEEEEEDLSIPTIDGRRLARTKSEYAGQVIRIRDVQLTSAVGTSVFWAELGDQSMQMPLLVRLNDAVRAEGETVEAGSWYTFVGTMQPMSDSVADAWTQSGELADESARMQATFADYFMEVNDVLAGTQPPAEPATAPAASPTPG